ncbi:MAG: sodium:solute symporter family protein [Clostridia bacterium]|nr:sodium:solute symporter family protein [Clostridia bacterium]
MSTTFMMISAGLIVIDLAACIIIGIKTKGKAANVEDYFIAGKRTGTLLLLLTAWASFSGAGNFIGHAGRGAMFGASAYWLWLGEGLLGGILIGYIMAPYLARFKYMSMPHYISDYLCGGDITVRRISGVASLFPNVVWPGGQIMGLAYVIQQVFNVDFRVAVIVCGAVFIYYTVNGGLAAVIYADALHGTIQMLFAAAVIFLGLKTFNFDIAWLGEQVSSIDPKMWNLFATPKVEIIAGFTVGLLGAISNPIFWNRAFAAKDVQTARKAYGITFFCNILLVLFIITIGISTFVIHQEVGDKALVWLILNKMPPWVGVFLALGVMAATMSCADTHLNCAAANAVVDIIDPEGKLPEDKGIKYSKIATLLAGIISIFGALYAPFIYRLGIYGYTVCGGVLIPAFVIGLIMRDRKSKEFKSKMNVVSARIGLGLGVVAAILFESVPSLYKLLSGGILPAVIATSLGILISNMFLKNKCNDTI